MTTAPPLSAAGLSRSVATAGNPRRRPHSGVASATATAVPGEAPPPPPPPRPAWVGIADSKLPLEAAAAEDEDLYPRRAATQGLRRGPNGKENKAAAGGGDSGRRGERTRRTNPSSSSRAGQPRPRSSSIPGRGHKLGGGNPPAPSRGKSAPPKTGAAAPRAAVPRTNKRKGGARVGTSARGPSGGSAGARATAFSANSGGRGGGDSHPPPYDSLGQQTLRRDGDRVSATAQRRWRPADGWINGAGGDGGGDTDEAWTERTGPPERSTRREGGGEPRRGVRGSGSGHDHDRAGGTVAAQRRFNGEPLREPFSRPFSRQEKGAEVEVGGRRQEEEEGGGGVEERKEGRGAAAAYGGEHKDERGGGGEEEGEGDSLDDRLPFMLASLKRVALTVHDLQGRCDRLSHGERGSTPVGARTVYVRPDSDRALL